MRIELKPSDKQPVRYQSQLPAEQQRPAKKFSRENKKAEPEDPRPPLELTPEQIAALEKEKKELLATLQAPRQRPEPVVEPTKVGLDEQEGPQMTAFEPEMPSVPMVGTVVTDVTAATTERKQLEDSLKTLEIQIVAARLRERQAQQAAVAAQQVQTQAVGTQQLTPLQPLLQRHLAAVVQIQTKWGGTLKDFARSGASGDDPQLRMKISAVYRAAAPLAQKLGEARATLESAIRGLTLALQSAHPHVHVQAKTLADAALSINVIALEAEIKSLVQLREELRPGYVVQSVTADRALPSSLEPRSSTPSADFGGSILA